MLTDSIVLAPELAPASAVAETWQPPYPWSRQTFYDFITAPSAEREAFLADKDAQRVWSTPILHLIYR